MIAVEIKDGWRKLVLNRPEKLNAVNPAMLTELIHALDAAEADSATRALLLTGNGGGFCVRCVLCLRIFERHLQATKCVR